MTVGEKIQFYRKKIGLSQEELGQKLLVSRQTISLWETDKTLPTIDSLLRLKEIFSVSVDDILSGSDADENKEDLKESYLFRYSRSELRKVFKSSSLPIITRFLVFLLTFAIFFGFLGAKDRSVGTTCFAMGCLLCGILTYIKEYFVCKKTLRSIKGRILESTYLYEVYDQYFILHISKNNETEKTLKINFADIEKIRSLNDYLIMQSAGESYIIKKDALKYDSAFFALYSKIKEAKKLRGTLRSISIWLCVCSVAAFYVATVIVFFLSIDNSYMAQYLWIFFLVTPIPIASIIFGVHLKKKGYNYKKNIVFGAVITALICIYGSFYFMFEDPYTHTDEHILKIEEMLSIDIPVHSRINTEDWSKWTQSTSRGYILFTSDIFFDESAVEEFEKTISSDSKWISSIPNDMIGITSYFLDVRNYDHFIIYNTQTKEFNKLPDENGTYRFVNVLYNSNKNTMKLVEYEIEYTK